MKLSRDEEIFLRHWIYDEAHYEGGQGPAKQLQMEHRVAPADIAVLVAASMPDLVEQEAAAIGPPPPEAPIWPWSGDACKCRLAEARALLARRKITTDVD
jgi:hypothetical protein